MERLPYLQTLRAIFPHTAFLLVGPIVDLLAGSSVANGLIVSSNGLIKLGIEGFPGPFLYIDRALRSKLAPVSIVRGLTVGKEIVFRSFHRVRSLGSFAVGLRALLISHIGLTAWIAILVFRSRLIHFRCELLCTRFDC